MHEGCCGMKGEAPPRLAVRRRRYRSGLSAELIAAAYLIAKRHRILARRYKTSAGEIDLVARASGRIAFIEVKRRATLEECEAAVTVRLRQRVRRAAGLWIARNPQFKDHDIGFDLVFIMPRRWPVYLRDAL